MTVPIVASNNLLSHGNMVWSDDSLKKMVKAFLGADFMLDHSWGTTEKTKGIIYDVEQINLAQAPPWATGGLDPDQVKTSKKIIRDKGYSSIVMYGSIEASSEIVSNIRYLRSRDVSIGGLALSNIICPLCETSFRDDECPHIPPHPSVLWWLSDEEKKLLAPYYINDGLYDGVELSIVTDGACAAARIMSEQDAAWYEEQLVITNY